MKYLLFALLLTCVACQPSVIKQREGTSIMRFLDAQVTLSVPTVPNGHEHRSTVWRTGRKLDAKHGWCEMAIDQDVYETWFITRTHDLKTTEGVSGEHLLNIPLLKSDRVITRVWIESSRPLTADDNLELTIEWLDAGGRSVASPQSLLAKVYRTKTNIVLAAPLESRLVSLPQGVASQKAVSAKVTWKIASASPLSLTMMVSPQRITKADANTFAVLSEGKSGWMNWMKQHGKTSELDRYSRFSTWFKHNAADYVQANLPRHRREHCYMQAYASRDWYEAMTPVDPESFSSVKLTPVWRWPNFHHVNLVTPHDYTEQAKLVEKQQGWIFDTWREDGYTINRIMPLKTFRKTFNKLELAQQGYMQDNVKRWQRLADPIPHTGGPVALEHR